MLSLCFSTPSSPRAAATTTTTTTTNKVNFGGKFPGNSDYFVAKSHYKKAFSTIISASSFSISSSSSSSNDRQEGVMQKDDLKRELMPKHVAMIMDGTRRWGAEKDLPTEASVLAAGMRLKDVVLLCCELGIEVLSLFASAPASFHLRSKEEATSTLNVTESALKAGMERFKSLNLGVRVSFIGNRARIPKSLLDLLTEAEEFSKNETRLHFLVAVDYTGRSDIVEACKSLSNKVKNGVIQEEDINDELFQQQLQTSCCSDYPNPDLFIRTGGKIRLANYMLWQMAYTELVFVDKLAPDFSEGAFVQALGEYQKRGRRFGGQN